MGADDPFGKFPRHVALLAGCAVALLLNRSMDVKDKLNIMTTSMGNSGVMMIVLIYLMAGGFQEQQRQWEEKILLLIYVFM